MMKPRILQFLIALLVCSLATFETPAADDAAQRQELNLTIERMALTLDVNQRDKFLIDFNFSSFFSMYAYRELMNWAQTAPEQQRSDLMGLTRAGLEAVVRDSGMGLPLEGWKGEGQPVGLLFSRGLPRYAALPNFTKPATLKWRPAEFKRQVSPASIGQSLAAKSLFVQMDTSDKGKKLGSLILESALQEFRALLPLLKKGGNKQARYMPALLKLKKNKWSVANTSSELNGKLSLIQGLTYLHTLLSQPALGNKTMSGKSVTVWRNDVHRALESVYRTTIKLHFDSRAGSFIGIYDPRKGASERLSANEAGFALEVLADMAASLSRNDSLHTDALKRLSAQADYVVAHMDGKTTAPQTFLVKKNRIFAGMLLQLEPQLAIINGLLAAKQATGKEAYGKTALAIFNDIFRKDSLWSNPAGVFRTSSGQIVSAYDGRTFGLALATWRRLEKLLPPGEAQQHGTHMIETILKQGGLQQAEGPATGEPKQPEDFLRDDLPQLLDSLITLKKEEQSEKYASAINALADQDGDAIPGCRFGGGRLGGAPVIVVQTSIKTAYDPPSPPPSSPVAAIATP